MSMLDMPVGCPWGDKFHNSVSTLPFFRPKIDFLADPIHPHLYAPDGQRTPGVSSHTPVPPSPSPGDTLLLPRCQEINTRQQQPSTTNRIGL